MVDPVPESMRGVGVAGWVRGQDSDEAQEVRGGRLERGQELQEKAAEAILGTNSYPDPEMTWIWWMDTVMRELVGGGGAVLGGCGHPDLFLS